MPASKHRATSSENASAVVAIMGIADACASGSARMAFVASMPFMTGICTSMSTRS